jgi:hypothetical protein
MPSKRRTPLYERRPTPAQTTRELVRVPVLVDGADPGRTHPSPLAVRERLQLDRHLVGDHASEQLFAYEVTTAHLKHLRGVAAPGDRIVFCRGGRVGPDRVCAVRTPDGIVLSRVLVNGQSLLLLPGEGEPASTEKEQTERRRGAIAGTHVALIRR